MFEVLQYLVEPLFPKNKKGKNSKLIGCEEKEQKQQQKKGALQAVKKNPRETVPLVTRVTVPKTTTLSVSALHLSRGAGRTTSNTPGGSGLDMGSCPGTLITRDEYEFEV